MCLFSSQPPPHPHWMLRCLGEVTLFASAVRKPRLKTIRWYKYAVSFPSVLPLYRPTILLPEKVVPSQVLRTTPFILKDTLITLSMPERNGSAWCELLSCQWCYCGIFPTNHTWFLSPDRGGIKDVFVLCCCLLLPRHNLAELTDKDGTFRWANPNVSITCQMWYTGVSKLWMRHSTPSQRSQLLSKQNCFKAVILESLLVISVSDICSFHVFLWLAFSNITAISPSFKKIPEFLSLPPSTMKYLAHVFNTHPFFIAWPSLLGGHF